MSKETESVELVVVQKLENALSAKINVADDAQDTPELEPEVNLCVKVPLSLRRQWAAEAKRQGTTMTAAIVEALEAKFGRPDCW